MKTIEGKILLKKEDRLKLDEIIKKTSNYCKKQKKEIEKILGEEVKVHFSMSVTTNKQGE